MGIKGLMQYVKAIIEKDPEILKTICYNREMPKNYNMFSAGVDLMLWAHRIFKIKAKDIFEKMEDIEDFEVEKHPIFIKSAYSAFIELNITLTNHKINPVWFLDGDSKEFKLDTHKKRQDKKDGAKKKIKDLTEKRSECLFENKKDGDKLKTMRAQNYFPSREFIKDFIKNMKKLGVCVVQSEGEAEAYAASLSTESNNELLFGVLTEDSDVFPIGTFSKIKIEKGRVLITYTENIYKNILGFENIEHFRNFCVLLGTDFNDRIYGLGPVKCHDIILKYKTIKDFLSFEGKDEYDCFRNSKDPSLEAFKKRYEKSLELLAPSKIDYSKLKIHPSILCDKKKNTITEVLKSKHLDDRTIEFYVNKMDIFIKKYFEDT
jgi:5'-3' exonuclease